MFRHDQNRFIKCPFHSITAEPGKVCFELECAHDLSLSHSVSVSFALCLSVSISPPLFLSDCPSAFLCVSHSLSQFLFVCVSPLLYFCLCVSHSLGLSVCPFSPLSYVGSSVSGCANDHGEKVIVRGLSLSFSYFFFLL